MSDSPIFSNVRDGDAGLATTYISRDEIQELPLYRYTGAVEVIRSDGEVQAAFQTLEREDLLGFDTETQPAFEKGRSFPTALLQLATSKTVFIFQLAELRRLDLLAAVLGSSRIVKVGVAVQQDINKLREVIPFEPAGFVDLAHLAAMAGIKNRGLRGLAALMMGIRVSKGARRSNWGQKRLTAHQIAYAAGDAWLCRQLYVLLQKQVSERRGIGNCPGDLSIRPKTL